MTLRLAIAGAAGRMGRALIAAALDDPGLALVGGTEPEGSPGLGQDLAALIGRPALGVTVTADPAAAGAQADVWIDFTTPAATCAALARVPGVAAVIGATGFDVAGEAAVAAEARRRPIVKSGNFSRGVAVLAALARQAAAALGPDWDVEIVEAHHRRKIDAPSGTALLLGEAAALGRGRSLGELRLPAREGIAGPRPAGAIGFSAVRGGGVVGDHDVLFLSERETIRLSHHAADRAIFADGALAAARWAHARAPGLYSMGDVLGL